MVHLLYIFIISVTFLGNYGKHLSGEEKKRIRGQAFCEKVLKQRSYIFDKPSDKLAYSMKISLPLNIDELKRVNIVLSKSN